MQNESHKRMTAGRNFQDYFNLIILQMRNLRLRQAEVSCSRSFSPLGTELEMDLEPEDHNPMFFLLHHTVIPKEHRIVSQQPVGSSIPQNDMQGRCDLWGEERSGKVQCLGRYAWWCGNGEEETFNCHKVTEGNRMDNSLDRTVGGSPAHPVC